MLTGTGAATYLPDLRFTAPAEYARTLRKAHEATISGNPDPFLSPGIIKSWQRSLALGIDPDQHRPVHRHDVSEARSLSAGHRLASVMPALSQLLADESAAGRRRSWPADGVPAVFSSSSASRTPQRTMRRLSGVTDSNGPDTSSTPTTSPVNGSRIGAAVQAQS